MIVENEYLVRINGITHRMTMKEFLDAQEPKELIKVTGETKKGLSTGFTPDNHLNAINLNNDFILKPPHTIEEAHELGELISDYMAIDFEQRKKESALMIEKYLVANPDVKPDAEGLYEWDITARRIRDGEI